MIYSVYFHLISDPKKIIQSAVFLDPREAAEYAESQGESFKVAKVDNWDSWCAIKEGVN